MNTTMKLAQHWRRLIGTWVETTDYRARELFTKVHSRPRLVPNDVLITVVIPTLCKGAHAHRLHTLKALLTRYLAKQTYEKFEAIVVSDGINSKVESLVERIGDPRIRYSCTKETSGFGGLPETRLGLNIGSGSYFVRMNDDNKPFQDYLRVLLEGFNDDIEFVYARVIFSGEAREYWRDHFTGMSSYILPNDRHGAIHGDNVDWMNFMFRIDIARQHKDAMCRSMYGDWEFISELMRHGARGRFIDRLIGHKC
jgi:hypothetical protein